jgi:hypothetical protein
MSRESKIAIAKIIHKQQHKIWLPLPSGGHYGGGKKQQECEMEAKQIHLEGSEL